MHTISKTDKDNAITIWLVAFDNPSAHVQKCNVDELVRQLHVIVPKFFDLAGGFDRGEEQ